MAISKERRGLIFSFLIIYLFIVLLLAGIVTAGFHLYRDQVSRSEAGLQVAVVAVEIGPLLVAAYQQQDEHQLAGAGLIYNQMAEQARSYYGEMKQTQMQLRESQARFRDMAEISTDWFYELDTDFNLVYLSEQFYHLTGLAKNQVIGKPISLLATNQEDHAKWEAYQDLLTAHKEFRQFEFRIRTGHGGDCVANISGKPVFDNNKKFQGYRGTGRDVTQFRQNQEALAEANQNFGDSVAYASHFQHRLLTSEPDLQRDFGEVRFIWQPRDLVGGDFLTHFQIGGKSYIVFYDCTGHGVPGGFMVMLVCAAIDRIRMQASHPGNCSEMLQSIHDEICVALGITPEHSATDGLDCAVLCLTPDKQSLEFAGANIDLLAVSETGEVQKYPALRQALGYRYQEKPLQAELHRISVDSRCFVLATDGIATQIGAKTGRMMGSRHFQSLLSEAKSTDPRKLANQLMRGLRRWQGEEERRDDVMILAFRMLPDTRR